MDKYLRRTIDYSSPGKVILLMVNYIGNMLNYITEVMKGESSKPAAHHLLEIAEDTTKLYQINAYIFHHFVAQLLYISKRASPYIQIAVSFLCNRVRLPGTDDRKKM